MTARRWAIEGRVASIVVRARREKIAGIGPIGVIAGIGEIEAIARRAHR